MVHTQNSFVYSIKHTNHSSTKNSFLRTPFGTTRLTGFPYQFSLLQIDENFTARHSCEPTIATSLMATSAEYTFESKSPFQINGKCSAPAFFGKCPSTLNDVFCYHPK